MRFLRICGLYLSRLLTAQERRALCDPPAAKCLIFNQTSVCKEIRRLSFINFGCCLNLPVLYFGVSAAALLSQAYTDLCVWTALSSLPLFVLIYQVLLFYFRQRGDVIGWIIYSHAWNDNMSHMQWSEASFSGRKLNVNNRSGVCVSEWSYILCWCPILGKKTKGMGQPARVTKQELFMCSDM